MFGLAVFKDDVADVLTNKRLHVCGGARLSQKKQDDYRQIRKMALTAVLNRLFILGLLDRWNLPIIPQITLPLDRRLVVSKACPPPRRLSGV